MIEVADLTKRFGRITAVERLSFTVPAGRVVGFLGPNGAGKTTTMRMILGLDHPTSGTVRVNGREFAQLDAPMREVGAVLDAGGIHPGMTARTHLRWLASAGRIPARRVGEVLDAVGLTEAAHRKVGGFSLGMRQRLGIASALLGDPATLLLDEPVNGLDPEGVLWIRTLMRDLAAEGRTVFLSSHLMNEMEETADRVVVIGRGHLVADMDIEEFLRRGSSGYVSVATPHLSLLTTALSEAGAAVEPAADGSRTASEERLAVRGLTAAQVGELAARYGITLHELTPQAASLEETFMELTRDSAQYTASGSVGGSGGDRSR
ncbi:ABC-2 type transport system ATP-binding protein [Lipingzhangella halophila]|uniref:ABC-2 type transport system ATP-binding protein n=1 Tax=Lipingzhangella halophila TaxID=1783352 RepID=A0A7W7W677_9ACTN|nr:ABC transporter ATP-binding protein [Lipingzhangella halophila]MBB4935533.1 ABC-2 type transport system ATP-binding protein [Lipingzhangella halophila]